MKELRKKKQELQSQLQQKLETEQEAKQKADALYREALELNRNGDYERAYTACQEALKYDPSNLQAQRMAERLSARVNRR
jgi:tetratricopeptide (TPR) repeat protein